MYREIADFDNASAGSALSPSSDDYVDEEDEGTAADSPPPGLSSLDLERYYKGELNCLYARAVDLETASVDLDSLMRAAMASDPACLQRLLQDEQYMRKLRTQHRSTLKKPCNCFAFCLGLCSRYFAAVHGGVGPKRRRAGKPDFSAQNELLESKLFDVYGNSLYHTECVSAILRVDKNRLSRRRAEVRVRYKTNNTEYLFKHAIPARRLGDVIVPPHVHPIAWWRTVREGDMVSLRRRSRHGLSNRASNNAYKAEARNAFLSWCEMNSMPTGRSTLYHPTRYFSSTFIRIGRYKDKELRTNPDLSRYSIVMVYRQCLIEQGQSRIPCEATLTKWLHECEHERYAIQPHQSDYCDTCARFRVQLNQLSGRRWAMDKVSGNASADERQLLDVHREALQREWSAHRASGKAEHDAYIASLAQAAEEWSALNSVAEDHREGHAVICVDYMQERTLPYFGKSAQPGETYYKQKLTVHLCGLVQHHDGRPHVFLSDERASGAKVADHLCSYLTQYVASLPTYVSKLTIWGDNAGTIKSQYLVGWAADCVEEGRLKEVNLRFMLPGHTKFSPDTLFASISATYRKRDVFSMAHLASVVEQHATPHVFDHDAILLYRQYLETRYTRVVGIRNLRWIRARVDNDGRARVTTSNSNTREPVDEYPILRANAQARAAPPARAAPVVVDPRKVKDLIYVYQRYAPDHMPEWLTTLPDIATYIAPPDQAVAEPSEYQGV